MNCAFRPRCFCVLVISATLSFGAVLPSPFAFRLETAPAAETGFVEEVLDLFRRGGYEAAEKKLAQNEDAYSLRLLLELAIRKGDRTSVERHANRLLTQYRRGSLVTSAELSQAAFAAWKLDRWQDANAIYLEAAKLTSVPASLYVDWGTLYLEKYNAAEAEAIFGDAIQALGGPRESERWGPEAAYLGLARALKEQGKPGVEEAVAKAEELDSASLLVMEARTAAAIQTSDWEKAGQWIDRGLKSNSHYVPLLELKAAYHYFQEESRRFERARDQALKINPANGNLFEILGDFCIPRRRLEEGIEFYREAVARDPKRWSALASLGINLLRMGQEAEGQQILEKAYDNDPFNIWTVNTLRLLDSFENFDRFETGQFKVKIEKSEAKVLWPYVQDLLERSLGTLTKKYDHPISEAYLFEMYNNHADFAVRTLGLPGLGALGATFGRVVAMDSPSARPGGKFHWGSTLWHEVAHVVTLSLSRQKVPRWLTEGISMREERLAAEGWGDFLTPGFVRAWEEKKLLSLSELNSGFERPRFPEQLSLSYFQAGWLCDFLAENYGFDKIRQMLVSFGEGKSMEEVFEQVVGASVEEVDKLFQEEVSETLRPLSAALKEPEKIEIEDPELALSTWVQAAQKSPDNYLLNLSAGRKLIDAGRGNEAVPLLKRAVELFPYAAGEDSPYALLSGVYEAEGRIDEWIDILKQRRKMSPQSSDSGLKLAQLMMQREDREAAVGILEDLMFVNPLNPELHQTLGDAYLQTGSAEKALREFLVLLELGPTDVAGTQYRIASALALDGQNDLARRHVLLALEIAPSFEEAQRLLLRLVRR